MTHHSTTLRGTFTALVTPMNQDGSVDQGALDALVDWQLAEGVEGLVPCGTTGESATLTGDERAQVIGRVVQRVNKRVPVIGGGGSNSTQVAIEHQKRLLDTGADYALVVTPYYNKPMPAGLIAHYRALWEAAPIPIVAYNVPGRTGCDMQPSTIGELAKIDGVVAIKEATGDLDRIAAIQKEVGEDFAILSGDDPTAAAFAFLGGGGVISVTSNVAPADMGAMIRAALGGENDRARELHNTLRPLFEALFIESNPIPVKAALAMQNRLQETYRLPLAAMQSDTRATVHRVMQEGGWLKA